MLASTYLAPRTTGLVLALAVAMQWSARALAADVAVLVDSKVQQLHQAADAAVGALSSAEEVDPSDPELTQKLAAAQILLAVGTHALSVARVHAAGKPIVFCMVLGLNDSDLAPNMTGVPLEPDPRQIVDFIHDLSGRFQRIGLVYDPSLSARVKADATREAQDLKVKLVALPASSAGDAKVAVEKLLDEVDVVWLPTDPKLFPQDLFAFVLSLCAEHHVAVVAFLESLAEAGALAAVSPDYRQIGAQAGKLAAEILAKPEGHRLPLPPVRFAPGNTTINLRSARALGIEVAAPAMAEAKRVIR